MKKHFNKIARYIALILISSIPFPMDVLADTEKEQNLLTLSIVDENTSAAKQKNSGRKSTIL
jgi:hypothetical protein